MSDKNFHDTYVYCEDLEEYIPRPTAGEKARRDELNRRFYADGKLPRAERYELLRLHEKINWSWRCEQGRCRDH